MSPPSGVVRGSACRLEEWVFNPPLREKFFLQREA
jgi:hypothetical protein